MRPNLAIGSHSKRRKSREACLSCRKHKTRCEMLESEPQILRCHRCNVLGIPCSFEPHESPAHESRTTTSPSGSESTRASPARDVREQVPLSVRTSAVRRIPESQLEWCDAITPESLLAPAPPGKEGNEWIRNPMLVMQILLRKRPSLSHVSSALSLNDVLTSNEINHLLAVFEHRYSPWLNMSLGFLSPHPFLVMVQCAVAARYLDPIRRSSVLPQIYGLVDSYVARLTFSSVQSLETVAAFLILSLWPSGAGTPDGSLQDSRMIASSAVSAAMQLSLDRSVTSAIQLHSSHVSNDGQLEIALNRVRLWLSLVSAEWMLCLGTGRTPTSRHADQDYEVLRRISPSTLHCGSRDLRLDFLIRIQSIAEKAIHMGTHEDDSEGVHRFRDEAGSILTQLDSVYSSIQPLASISDYETYHFQMLILQYHTYRLLALCRFLEELRSHAVHNGLGAFQSKGWVAALEPLQRRLTAQWGMAAIIAAQSVLITFLAAPVSDEDLLSTPDNVLAMISLSGAVVILTKTSLMRDYGNGDGLLLHSSDALVPRVVARLHRIADASMCAARCAEVLEIVHGTWKTEHDVYLRTTQQQTRGEKRRRESTPGPPHSTGECLTAEQQEGQAMFSGIPYEGLAFDSIFAQNMYAGPGQDILLDMEFWGAFTQNLHGT